MLQMESLLVLIGSMGSFFGGALLAGEQYSDETALQASLQKPYDSPLELTIGFREFSSGKTSVETGPSAGRAALAITIASSRHRPLTDIRPPASGLALLATTTSTSAGVPKG